LTWQAAETNAVALVAHPTQSCRRPHGGKTLLMLRNEVIGTDWKIPSIH
jgi:hypothetical protein